MNAKRVLWLLNHNTLREAEVPMLRAFGLEVFIPKSFPRTEENMSAGVTYAYDASLTIPADLLHRMNAFDFYRTYTWPADLAADLNAHFDVAICACFPALLDAACAAFAGPIFIRAFGREGLWTYRHLLADCQPHVKDRLWRKDNIWFTAAYPNVSAIEPDWLQRCAVVLPIGLGAAHFAAEDQWHYTRPEILFVCQRIKTAAYYREIYREFKWYFGDLPHVIVGGQAAPVLDDPTVLNMVAETEYRELMRSCACLLYNPRSPRHVHYHPLEAFVVGLPVVFMAGGQLEAVAGPGPGCCATLREARLKVQRLLAGDAELAAEICAAQRTVRAKFHPAHVTEVWRERFLPLISIITAAMRLNFQERGL